MHSRMKVLPNPVKVSPVIKFFRYTFLIVGIIYGASKRKAFQTKESGKKEERERLKLLRDSEIEKEKKAASDKEMAQIAAIFNGESQSKFKEEHSYDTAEENMTIPCRVEEVKQELSDNVNALAHANEANSVAASNESCGMFSNENNIDDDIQRENDPSSGNANQLPENDSIKLTNKNGYYIENFSSKVPYVTPDNKKFDFHPKNMKE